MSEAQDTSGKPSQEENADKLPQSESDEAPKPKASLPERVTLAVAVLLIAGLGCFLGWHGLREAIPETAGSRPRAKARVEVTQAVPQSQGWAVPIAVENTGNVPMRQVIVKVDVQDVDGKRGERELTFGYLAEGATETGYVTTFVAPDATPPTATIQSFQTKADARGY